MVAVATVAYVLVSYVFLISFLLFFLETELDPIASELGSVGLVGSIILGIGVAVVFGPPPNQSQFTLWFTAGFLSVSSTLILLHALRWILIAWGR